MNFPKYRVWDDQHGEEKAKFWYSHNQTEEGVTYADFWSWIQQHPGLPDKNLQAFTGAKDVDDVDVYVGDLVLVEGHSGEKLFVVEQFSTESFPSKEPTGFVFNLYHRQGERGVQFAGMLHGRRVKVVGNIFEGDTRNALGKNFAALLVKIPDDEMFRAVYRADEHLAKKAYLYLKGNEEAWDSAPCWPPLLIALVRSRTLYTDKID